MGVRPNSNTRTEVGGKRADRVTVVGAFTPPANSDAITVEYPDTVTEVYKYRQGGVGGTILNTVTVIYTAAAKKDISSVVIT